MARISTTLLTVFLSLPAVAAGAPDSPPEDPPGNSPRAAAHPYLRDSTSVVTAFVAEGLATEINGSEPIDIFSFGLRWTHLAALRGGGALRGRPGFGFEVLPLMIFDQDPRPYAVGGHLLLEHHFAASARIFPVLRLGAGALQASTAVPVGETEFNFSLFAGLGIDIPIGNHQALTVEYRLHHVSNAETGDRNPGINAQTLVGGLTFFRR